MFLNRKFLVIGIIILLVSVFAFYFYYAGNNESGLNPLDQNSTPDPNSSPEPKPSTIHIDKISTCVSVIDGDTIEICSRIRVRLADIDAPESYETGYEKSANALKSIVLENKVYLDIDGKDQYGRFICVLYVLSNSRYKNVNYELVSGGFAIYDDYDNAFNPNSWSMYESNVDITQADVDRDCPSTETPPSTKTYVGSRNSNKYHELTCYWVSQIKSENRVYFTSKVDAQSKGYVPCKVCNP
jgi:endonuclease YncB( thermonuclease family)